MKKNQKHLSTGSFINISYAMLMSHFSYGVKSMHFSCVRRRYAIACIPDYKRLFRDLDAADEQEAHKDKVKKLTVKMPNVVKCVKDDNVALNNLLYMDILYTPPLSADSRILFRRKVLKLIDDHDLPEEAICELLEFLKDRGAV